MEEERNKRPEDIRLGYLKINTYISKSMGEVELYKIATILSSGKKPGMMMVVHNAGEPCDSYVKILREHCKEYSFMKTDKSIIGAPKMSMKSHIYEGHSIKGTFEYEPTVGKGLSLGHWRTSVVDRIIEDCVIITRNSVYAIHDLALIREKKLNDLGI
jgi:hypothetical protein